MGYLLTWLPNLLPQLKSLLETVVGNRAQRERSEVDEQIAIHEEQAAGYSYKAPRRTDWDSFVDGLNRLPRPIGFFGCCALLVMPFFWPDQFTVAMRALEAAPVMLWNIIAMVFGFVYGSRLIAKDLAKGATAATQKAAQQYFENVAAAAPVVKPRGAAEVAEDWRKGAMNRG